MLQLINITHANNNTPNSTITHPHAKMQLDRLTLLFSFQDGLDIMAQWLITSANCNYLVPYSLVHLLSTDIEHLFNWKLANEINQQGEVTGLTTYPIPICAVTSLDGYA
jgi:hypothetical protein